MTKPLEEHIAELQDVIDGPAGRYWCHRPAVSALITALEQSQKHNADLQRDELAEAAAKELRRVENLYTESQKRVAELEQAKPHHNGFMHLSQELIEANGRITDLESQRQMAFMAGNRWADKFRESEARVAELESQNLTTSNALLDAGKRIEVLEASQLAVKLPEQYSDDRDLLFSIDLHDEPDMDLQIAMWLKELRRRRTGTVGGDK